MDYKEAYDDICQKLMSAYNTTSFIEVKKAIGQIHPELRESEGERINKAIFKALSKKDARNVLLAEGVQVSEALAYLEKQKEQKPAEWSEDDETAYSDLIWCIEQASKSAKDENDMGNIWFAENWVKNRLKSLRGRLKSSDNWKPQPKEEGCDYITPNKEFFQWIYNRLVYVHKENPNVDYMRSYKKRIDSSVFGQYHWKPSDGEMSMLLAVINDPNNAGLESCHLALISIYEQLKKL